MALRLSNFMGEAPRAHPRSLPDGYAQLAEGARMENGMLSPRRQERIVTVLSGSPQRIVRHNDSWFGLPEGADAVPGPTDAERLYITGDGVPQVYTPTYGYLDLALPPPASAPIITIINPAGFTVAEDAIGRDVVFAYTFVTRLGEESAPSPLSTAQTYYEGQHSVVSGFSAPVSGREISAMRIYRSQTSALGTTDLFFIKEIPEVQGSFTHDIDVDPLQELIISRNYDMPVDELEGIVTMPNGMMAAFAGTDLYFSEPYRPHAWPNAYSLSTDYEIVGLAAFGSNLAIMTKGTPYFAQGTVPEAMIMTKLEQNLPCVAKRGIVDLGYAAAYPSNDGLVTISQDGAALASRNLFTREQWNKLNPETFRADQHESRYVFSWLADGTIQRQTAMIDLTGAQPYLIRDPIVASDFFYDITDNNLYALVGGNDVVRFDDLDEVKITYTWRSKLFQTPDGVTFSCMLIEADVEAGETLAVDIIADGNLLITHTEGNQFLRLPDGLYKTWEIEARGNAQITSIILANEPSELAQA